MPVGVGALSWGAAIPIALSPDVKRPNTGNAIVVYALPEATRPGQPVSNANAAQPSTDSVAAIRSAVAKLPVSASSAGGGRSE
jgi:hypothetical protein